MKKFNFLKGLVFAFLFSISASSCDKKEKVVKEIKGNGANKIYFFWGKDCPFCKKQKLFMENLLNKYEDIQIIYLEVWNNNENKKAFYRVLEKFGIKEKGVPTTFIGKEYIIGYEGDETTGKKLEEIILSCRENGCEDVVDKIIG